jgi:hypothetical protein
LDYDCSCFDFSPGRFLFDAIAKKVSPLFSSPASYPRRIDFFGVCGDSHLGIAET